MVYLVLRFSIHAGIYYYISFAISCINYSPHLHGVR